MEMNQSARVLLSQTTLAPASLSPSLKKIAEEGFTKSGGAYLCAHTFHKRSQASLEDFHDIVSYEVFINSLAIDLLVKESALPQAFAFADALSDKWKTFEPELKLIFSITIDRSFVNLKFHLCRPDIQWLDRDLETYSQPIIRFDSGDRIADVLFGPFQGHKDPFSHT